MGFRRASRLTFADYRLRAYNEPKLRGIVPLNRLHTSVRERDRRASHEEREFVYDKPRRGGLRYGTTVTKRERGERKCTRSTQPRVFAYTEILSNGF